MEACSNLFPNISHRGMGTVRFGHPQIYTGSLITIFSMRGQGRESCFCLKQVVSSLTADKVLKRLPHQCVLSCPINVEPSNHIQPLFFGSTWFDGNRMEKSHGLGLGLRLMVVLKPFAKRNRQNPRFTRPWDYFMIVA